MREQLRKWAGLGALALLVGLAACTPPTVPEGTTDEGDADAGAVEETGRAPVTFTATEYEYAGPDTIAGGMTEIEFVNDGEHSHAFMLLRAEGDRTLEDIGAMLMATGDSEPIPDWVSLPGGIPGIPGGTRASAVIDLEPGTYAAFSFESAPGEEMPDAARGMLKMFTVTEPEGAEAAEPEAALTVDMYEYRFETEGSFAAGPQTIRVVNEGEQPHEAIIMRLAEGVTVEDFLQMMQEGGPPEGASEEGAPAEAGTPEEGDAAEAGPPEEMGEPVTSMGGMSPLDPSGSGFATVDLAPGNYALICFFPDTEDGVPHVAKGMHMEFTVE
jgi:hypothetical protein